MPAVLQFENGVRMAGELPYGSVLSD